MIGRRRLSSAVSGMLFFSFLLGVGFDGRAQEPYSRIPPPGVHLPKPPAYNLVHAPVPTHRFWTAKNWFARDLTDTGGAYTIFADPLAVQTTAAGLRVGYSPQLTVAPSFFLHPVEWDLTVGFEGLHAESVPVTDFSDWTVDFRFETLTTRIGRGMPFVYGTTEHDPVITFAGPPAVMHNEGGTLGVTIGSNAYGLFCPRGSTWAVRGLTATCHLPPGQHFFSLALLPQQSALALFRTYAFSFPRSTRVSWSYDEDTSRVFTTFTVSTEEKDGRAPDGFLQALYPHQYTSLKEGAHELLPYSYVSAHGPLRLLRERSFTTTDVFPGLLPALPVPADNAERTELRMLLGEEHARLEVADTYTEGKQLARVAQLLPLASAVGFGGSSLQQQLEDAFGRWFTTPGQRGLPEFVYDRAWGTLIGYPASFGSDTQLNDHHFQYGYWIHAAALAGLYDPAWLRSSTGGKAIEWLIRDIATPTRTDSMFPFLRHFDVYAGHSWASGQAPFGDGENEESSSEAINAWAGIALFASETGDRALRDTAIWLYTLETNAARDYWFNDGPVSTFPPTFAPVQICNLFDGKSDTATWFGAEPAFEHGIEFLPFTGASLYLGRDPAYVRRNLAEVLRTQKSPASWPDLLALYQAFYDPAAAILKWRQTHFTFDGETRAHEYAWLTSLDALGEVDGAVTANTVFYAVFRKPASNERHHVAWNLSEKPLDVAFSDDVVLHLPPRSYAIDDRSFPIQP